MRQVLAHLEDLGYLELHPLSAAVAPFSRATGLPPARILRTWLQEAIEDLRVPEHGGRDHQSRMRLYDLARLRYLESWPVTEVRDALAITHSEYYRQHTHLLVAVSAAIEARLGLKARPHDRTAPVPETARRSAANEDDPFVGRSSELEMALDAYAAAASGIGGRVIAVGGENGVGKTRFAEEVGRRVLARGGLFLLGRHQRGSGAVFGPWVDALRPALAGTHRGDLARLVGPFGPALALIFPELTVAGVAGPPGEGADRGVLAVGDQRQRLRDGIVHLLRELSAMQPLLVVVDDLQWAPDADLLAHVGRSLATARVLLLVAYRTHALRARSGLREVLDEAVRSTTSARLLLEPLSEDETTALAQQRLGETAGREVGPPLFEVTRGNPFLVQETLRSLIESGALVLAADGWQLVAGAAVRLPASAQQLVIERLSELGAGAAETLAQASLLGQEFSYQALQSLLGMGDDALVGIVERALEAEVLVDRTAAGDERYAFADEYLYRVLCASLSAPRRRQLLRRVGALTAADPALSI